jgi:hypothetical protein
LEKGEGPSGPSPLALATLIEFLMAPPPPFRATVFDSVWGTIACGVVLTVVVALVIRVLVLGHV